MKSRIKKLEEQIKKRFDPDPDLFDGFLFHLEHKEPSTDERIEKAFESFLKNLNEE